jgi:nucleotide-binding universal stress UspA family protein
VQEVVAVIVVGIDYSEDARRALRWAAYEGRVAKTPVTAVHAGPPVYEPVAKTPLAADRRAALLPELVAFVGETLGTGHDVSRTVVDGPAAEALVRCSRDADLLVVGRHGRGAVARLLMGSTSHDVVRHARCPVAVVPQSATAGPVRRVVVGTDGSDAAAAAVSWASAEAVRREVPLLVVHAAPPPPLVSALPMPVNPNAGDYAQAFLDDTVAKITAETGGVLVVESTLSWLAPAPALLTAAQADDLLVVGSRGSGALAHVLLGSTSSVVAEQSSGTVVVVPST